jgi:hypothetical protein
MTVTECEAILGPREIFRANSANRTILRKWAVANGTPSTTVYRLRTEQLATMYRDGAPAPAVAAGFTKESRHLALDDIRDSVDELRYYRERLFRADILEAQPAVS